MLGFIIGVASGAIQYFLLTKFTGSVTSGKLTNKAVLFGLVQFLLPFTVLVGIAFLLPDELMLAAIGMGGALLVSAIVRFIFAWRSK